jgi:hypothetical protein
MSNAVNPASSPPMIWRQSDGRPVSCVEKIQVLNENLAEIRQLCQDAFEDGLLMGCDETQLREALARVTHDLVNPFTATATAVSPSAEMSAGSTSPGEEP